MLTLFTAKGNIFINNNNDNTIDKNKTRKHIHTQLTDNYIGCLRMT